MDEALVYLGMLMWVLGVLAWIMFMGVVAWAIIQLVKYCVG